MSPNNDEILQNFTNRLEKTSDATAAAWCVIEAIFEKTDRYIDAVVYLADENRLYLSQIAAYGQKTMADKTIKDPIYLERGEGIVGNVFATRRSRILSDTSRDSNYIIDDRFRLSELAVPILHNDEIYGVLDSESNQEGFFTSEDQLFFEKIAQLLGAHLAKIA